MKSITEKDLETLQRYNPDIEYLTWDMDEKDDWEYVLWDALIQLLK